MYNARRDMMASPPADGGKHNQTKRFWTFSATFPATILVQPPVTLLAKKTGRTHARVSQALISQPSNL
jgi:hypothetical protein